jgi:hypothetical protein
VRNPRAFIPLNRLRTDAGIDHDFNFISSIERARQRAEKDVVEIRQLLSEKELRPANEEKQFRKVWHGDELHHIPVQVPLNAKHGQPHKPHASPAVIDSFDKHVRRRLRFLDIQAVAMPRGMTRQKENKTAWNRRTQTINWQVEWLVFNPPGLDFPVEPQQPLRVLCKSLEGRPFHSALASALEWHRGQRQRQQHDTVNNDPNINENNADEAAFPPKKRLKPQRPPQTQDPTTTGWPATPYTMQSSLSVNAGGGGGTATWNRMTTLPSQPTTLEDDLVAWQFFLLKASRMPTSSSNSNRNSSNNNKNNLRTLIPLASTNTLTSALSGRTVIEFPTLIVLPPGRSLPDGYELASGPERRTPRGRNDGHGTSIKNYIQPGSGQRNGKRPFQAETENGTEGGSKGRGGYKGGGNKRVRFEPGREKPAAPVVNGVEDAESEGEEGEVDSDGDDVTMGEAAVDGDGLSGSESVSDSDNESDSESGPSEEESGAVPVEAGSKSLSGLVDYSSEEESD